MSMITTVNSYARFMGYTLEVIAETSTTLLSLLVMPDADFDSQFTAWDLDSQVFITVNGWLFDINEAV